MSAWRDLWLSARTSQRLKMRSLAILLFSFSSLARADKVSPLFLIDENTLNITEAGEFNSTGLKVLIWFILSPAPFTVIRGVREWGGAQVCPLHWMWRGRADSGGGHHRGQPHGCQVGEGHGYLRLKPTLKVWIIRWIALSWGDGHLLQRERKRNK